MVWVELYKKNYSNEITPELAQLAEREEYGWRKLFFTNKLKLQVVYLLYFLIISRLQKFGYCFKIKLELRRQAKRSGYDDESSVYHTPRRPLDNQQSVKTRNSKSASNKLRYSAFLTED